MALQSLDRFCHWLSETSLSQTIQTVGWVIPAVQTVHILAVAAVVGWKCFAITANFTGTLAALGGSGASHTIMQPTAVGGLTLIRAA